MSRTLLIDPRIAGASGDMLVAALVDAGGDPVVLQELARAIEEKLDFVEEFRVEVRDTRKNGFRAKKLFIHAHEHRGHEHGHEHHHEHEHEYTAHEMLNDALEVADSIGLSRVYRGFVEETIKALIRAECRVHGIPEEEAHFHELASSDTIFDVVGVYALLENMGFKPKANVYSLPPVSGVGRIRMEHGSIPAPAPAVLEIAREYRVPIETIDVDKELLTPTGMALIAVSSIITRVAPEMVVESIGYGAGEAEVKGIPNVTRVLVGSVDRGGFNLEPIVVLETNIDDSPGEVLGHVINRLLEEGALDVQVLHSTGKKSRPSYIVKALVKPGIEDRIARALITETGTLGVRVYRVNRYVCKREIVTERVRIGSREYSVRVKVSRIGGEVVNAKPEYSDLEKLSRETGIPLRKLKSMIEKILLERYE